MAVRTQTHLPRPDRLAIDHGTFVSGIPSDQRGVLRPQGTAFDVGSVELRLGNPYPDTDCDANANPNANEWL